MYRVTAHPFTKLSYTPDQVRFIHHQFIAKKMSISHIHVDIPIKKHLLDIQRDFPETVPMSMEIKNKLRDEILLVITYPGVSKEIIRYCITYLERRDVW